MKLLDIHRSVQRLIKRLWTVEAQGQYFDGQKASIRELTLYPWYKYIIEYRESETETAVSKLADIKTPKEELPYRQAKYNCSIQFLSFLDNMKTDTSLN